MADTLLANAVYVPDGRLVGTGLIASVVDTNHGMTIGPTLTAATYTLSVLAAKGAKDWIAIGDITVDPPNCGCFFNVSTGVKGTVGSAVTASGILGPYKGFAADGTTPLDFYRCWVAFTGTAAAHTLMVLAAHADGDNTFAGDGATVSTYFWGAQVELGSRPSSPVITTGAAATRIADDLIQDPSHTLDGYDKGTIICNVISDAPAIEEGTLITVAGASNKLVFHTDSSEHISMKTVPNPS